MAARYEVGSTVVLRLPAGEVSAEVVADDGGEAVVVKYTDPDTGRETAKVPIARHLLVPAAGGEAGP